MKLLLTSVMLLGCIATSNGQTIAISDDSDSQSPVSLKGTMTFTDAPSPACSLNGHNQTEKPIIAAEVVLKFSTPSGEPAEAYFLHDHFFKTLTLSEPQSDFAIASDCEIAHEYITRRPAPPEAHAQVLFVQYEDGSVWGGGKDATKLMADRRAVIQYFQTLQATYSTNGLDGLTQALAVNQKSGTAVWNKLNGLRMTRDRGGIDAAQKMVEQQLATAEVHKAALLK